MTEAELQRLAEVMVQIVPGTNNFNNWRALGGFTGVVLGGILLNLALDEVRARRAQKEKLRQSRIDLYRALWDYKMLLTEIPDLGTLEHGRQVWEANTRRSDAVQVRINTAINAGWDKKYGRIVYEKLFFPVYQRSSEAGRASEMRAVDEVIRSLEPEALSLTEQLFDDLRASLGKPSEEKKGIWARLTRWFGRLIRRRGGD